MPKSLYGQSRSPARLRPEPWTESESMFGDTTEKTCGRQAFTLIPLKQININNKKRISNHNMRVLKLSTRGVLTNGYR